MEDRLENGKPASRCPALLRIKMKEEKDLKRAMAMRM